MAPDVREMVAQMAAVLEANRHLARKLGVPVVTPCGRRPVK